MPRKTATALSDLEDLLLDILDAEYPVMISTSELEAKVPVGLLGKPQATYKALMRLTTLGYVRSRKEPMNRALLWYVATDPREREREMLALIRSYGLDVPDSTTNVPDTCLPTGA